MEAGINWKSNTAIEYLKLREKKVFFVTQITALVIFILNIPSSLIGLILQIKSPPLLNYFLMGFQISFLILTIISIIIRRKNYFASKLFMMGTLFYSLLVNSIMYGNESAIGLLSFILILCVYFIFDSSEKHIRFVLIILYLICLLICEVTSFMYRNGLPLFLLGENLALYRVAIGHYYWINFLVGTSGFLLATGLFIKETSFLFNQITAVTNRFDQLLHNVFPGSVVDALSNKGTKKVLSWEHSNAAVFMADLCGFTRSVKELSPEVVIYELNQIYQMIDQYAAKYSVTKIKTIGDGYLAVCGAPVEVENPVEHIMQFAFAVQKEFQISKMSSAIKGLDLRIGIDAGGLISGVIGSSRSAYDIWGNIVNRASRLESTCIPGGVHVSEKVYMQIQHDFQSEHHKTELKGFGIENTYQLKCEQ